jgi:anti-anti-sigma regulatory factor
MSWQIKSEGGTTVVLLESDLGIQNAGEFHQAMLPLIITGGAVRINAHAAKSIHTSIMQILYALSKAVPDFAVIAVSEDFRATEARIGFSLPGSNPVKTLIPPPKPS